MLDTITLETLPTNPFALAGYTGGNWPTFGAMRQRYPHAHTVSIAIAASEYADCLDVEPGDAAPWQAPGWVASERRAGYAKPCVYSSWYEWHEYAALRELRNVWRWDADYTYVPHIDVGFDGTQWTDHAAGLNLDESLVRRPFLSIAHPPLSPCDRACRAHLRVLRHESAVLWHRFNAHGCEVRVRHHHRLGPRCRAWGHRLIAVNNEIKVLERRLH
jgi:hypothetical protein